MPPLFVVNKGLAQNRKSFLLHAQQKGTALYASHSIYPKGTFLKNHRCSFSGILNTAGLLKVCVMLAKYGDVSIMGATETEQYLHQEKTPSSGANAAFETENA